MRRENTTIILGAAREYLDFGEVGHFNFWRDRVQILSPRFPDFSRCIVIISFGASKAIVPHYGATRDTART